MESPFIFNKFVTGPDFVPRSAELNLLTDMLNQKQNCLIIEPAKSGKKSLVNQALLVMQKESANFRLCEINLFNVKTQHKFLCKLVNKLLRPLASKNDELQMVAREYLNKIPHSVSNPELNSNPGVISISKNLNMAQKAEIMNLPEKLSEDYSTNFILYFEEFQELATHNDAIETYNLINKTWPHHSKCTYLITGSYVNAMNEIFNDNKLLGNKIERIRLEKISEKYLSEFVIRNFQKAGKVIPKEVAELMCKMTDNHPWYTQHLADICFGLTRGYVNQQVLVQAFGLLLEYHSRHFKLITHKMSHFQLNLLRAVLDGHNKFSSNDMLEKYELQSSANVNRLKEAVQKKEIILFEKGNALFLDPLFRTWLKDVFYYPV
jgi:hypothetical protein